MAWLFKDKEKVRDAVLMEIRRLLAERKDG